ncbi:MAG: SAP domain-containing protein [Clostridiales bacterium]|nr:SAP domain-containing protein [Clostridiales bacterium]
MERPKFEQIKSYAEFCKYYWYWDELQAICKNLGLEYVGSKIELNEIIRAYFDGERILHKPKARIKPVVSELTLNTPLLACGFTFGPKFRDFFIRVTGDKNFKFTADTVATAKAVKQNGDGSFTLGDLLDVRLGKSKYAEYDKSSCQWNKFLHDFCADDYTARFPDRLKAASMFWARLRDSDLPKVYSREFILQNADNVDL